MFHFISNSMASMSAREIGKRILTGVGESALGSLLLYAGSRMISNYHVVLNEARNLLINPNYPTYPYVDELMPFATIGTILFGAYSLYLAGCSFKDILHLKQIRNEDNKKQA